MNKKFWRKRRVLITGYEGFLGSALTKRLISSGAIVSGIDIKTQRKETILSKDDYRNIRFYNLDISDYKKLNSIISKLRPQVIFHLAAEAIVSRALKDPLRAFKSNIEGTWNVLEASRGKKFIQSVIVASSDKAYGASLKLPYSEETPLKGEFPYDGSKSCADILSKVYFNTYNLPLAVVRCGNIYGPGDYNFSRLVPDAIRCALKNKQFLVRSDGKYARDYVYIDDIVNGYVKLAEKMRSNKLYGQAFNLSNEKPVTVLRLLKVLSGLLEKKLRVKILNQAKFEIRNQYLSATRAKKALSWKPEYDLRQGLKETIQWYRGVI